MNIATCASANMDASNVEPPPPKDSTCLASCCSTACDPSVIEAKVVAPNSAKSACCSLESPKKQSCCGNDDLQAPRDIATSTEMPIFGGHSILTVESEIKATDAHPIETLQASCCSTPALTKVSFCGNDNASKESCDGVSQTEKPPSRGDAVSMSGASTARPVKELQSACCPKPGTFTDNLVKEPQSTCCSKPGTSTDNLVKELLSTCCSKPSTSTDKPAKELQSTCRLTLDASTTRPVEALQSTCCSTAPVKKTLCCGNKNPKEEDIIQILVDNRSARGWKDACFEVKGMTCTGCENTLNAALSSHPSIGSAKSNMFLNRAELLYDPTTLSTDRIIEIIVAAGFSATLQRTASGSRACFNVTRSTNDSTSDLEKSRIHTTLEIKGIVSIDVTAHSIGHLVDVSFDPEITGARDIARALQYQGYIVELATDDHERSTKGMSELVRMRHLLVIGILLVVPIVCLAFIFPNAGTAEITPDLSIRNFVLFILATPLQLYIGVPIYRGAWNGLVLSRELNMDSLVILSTSCAYFYSTIAMIVALASSKYSTPELFFETSAILMTLIILGRYLQAMARGRAADALGRLKSLHNPTANLVVTDKLGNGSIECIESGYLQRRDIIKVLPSDRIPADGTILRGTADVDESNMTGESVPVSKGVSDNVMGGSININGTLLVQVTRVQSESKLSDITRLVEQAQASKAPSQAYADKIATWFTPFVILLGGITYLIWLILGLLDIADTSEYPSGVLALTFAIAVLVVSCPCAIALAVPTVIVVGAGVGAKHGILVKDGGVFEDAAGITHVVFDKTGTLTRAEFQVVGCLELEKTGEQVQNAYNVAAAAACNSEHPLSVAVASYCRERQSRSLDPEASTAHPGSGLSCVIDGTEVRVGKISWVLEKTTKLSSDATETFLAHSRQCGWSIVAISQDQVPLLLFALADGPRPEAAAVVSHLKSKGVQVHIISGDHQAAVEHIGQQLSIEPSNAIGDCTPSEKLDHLVRLQAAGHRVAFCGDGTNDAPVLTQANVGIAMGAGTSSQVAIASAKAVLLTNDLRGVIITLDLARSVMTRIRLNFAWAFLYNLLVIPLAAGCFVPVMENARIPPTLAGLGELVSVMPVLVIALLLKRYRSPSV
ncbi:hypothetical protein BGW38_009238 [Lunasporangiospora selenospora]|uniref:HMA domain-containing protein n=1 Tax=Lunasporangiospora selenospora TaxID=979761 RepID=A0A9P6KG14_9FUNG|nr:hypothetical protein BGW38_009238 [Lunasporangiospora selenospora]